MIVVRLAGALGNQLFQYAFGRALASRLHTQFKIDKESVIETAADSTTDFYRLSDFNVKENFATRQDIKNLQLVKENGMDFHPEILNCSDNSYLGGHWMCEKYFKDIEDILRKEFTLKKPLEKNSAAWEKKILSAACPVSVHLRLTGYVVPSSRQFRGNLSRDYYVDCVNELKKSFPQMELFIFSDSLDWAEEILPDDLGVPMHFVAGCENDFEEIYLMSICKHNIISNGTFAWWGAWLNKNPNKKVFAPDPWHRTSLWFGKDVVPESWIKIPARYENNPNFPPFLSIIFCVENNSEETAFNLSTTLQQNFLDYEVIIADKSGGEGERLSRRFAGSDKVTYLKLNDRYSKIAAWNRGLENASGQYVLFLSDKDFIFPQATMQLSEVWMDDCRAHYMTKENYIGLNNYYDIGAEVVCATRYFVEDKDGAEKIQGIDDKKFSMMVDAPFKDLQGIATTEIEDAQSLNLLSSGQIDNSLSTKFFKRNLLEKNSIRFSEVSNGGMGFTELLFLLNTFTLSKKIAFVPAVFTGRLK